MQGKLLQSEFKIIEKEYFKNLYKIKKGENYNRAKDPYFKNIKTNSDFHHPHHKKILPTGDDPALYITEEEKQNSSLSQCNPLNPIALSTHLYGSKTTPSKKNSSKYRSSKLELLSPEQAYSTNNSRKDSFGDAESSLLSNEGNEKSFSDYDGPNLLTVAMKDEIRLLNSTDPENWSPEVISSVYPVSIAAAQVWCSK